MRTKCYSVRLQGLTSISVKAYKATAFDGSTAIIPKSMVYGPDYEVQKSDAYWIAAWILEKKSIQFSKNKVKWFKNSKMNKSNFIITSDNRVFYGKTHIGEIAYLEASENTEIACFLPGGESFSHKTVHDTDVACEIIYNKFHSSKS